MKPQYLFSDESIDLNEDVAIDTNKQYRKMLFRFGDYIDQSTGKRDTQFNEDLANEVKRNFDNKVIQHVPVPVDHDRNPMANAGELMSVEVGDDGLYGIIEIRDWDVIRRIDDELIFDVSIGIYWDYEDTETGESMGATLFHVALVNDPYIEHMSGFEAILAKASDNDDEYVSGRRTLLQGLAARLSKEHSGKSAIMFSVSANNKRKEYAMEVDVTNTRDFDVKVTYERDGESVTETVVAGEVVTVPADQEESVKKQIEDAVAPEDVNDGAEESGDESELSKEGEESDDDKSGDDKDGKESEDKDEKVELSKGEVAEYAKLRKENAELKANEAYAKMLDEGFITPAQESVYKELKLASILESGHSQFSKADGSKFSLTDKLDELIRAGGKRVEFSQDGSRKADEQDDSKGKTLSSQLSQTDRDALAKRHNISADRIDELAKKNPKFAESMKNLIDKES